MDALKRPHTPRLRTPRSELQPGRPWPLGAHWVGHGVNFAVLSGSAQRIDLCLFDARSDHESRRLVSLKSGRTIDTKQILFICGGAFVGLESILAETQAFGFIATSQSDDQKVLDRLNARVKPTDLFRFGLIPEFAGALADHRPAE